MFENRLKWRKYINSLKLDVLVMLYRMVFGGFIGILNFIWKVFGDDSNDLEVLIKNIKIVNKINKLFLKFLIRFMRK